jgi:hypothetical protein
MRAHTHAFRFSPARTSNPCACDCATPQALGFVNAQLFNQLLLRPELCCTANARYALRGLKQVDGLLLQLGEGQLGKAGWAALDHTRQVERRGGQGGRVEGRQAEQRVLERTA